MPAGAGMTHRRIDAHQHYWRVARGDYGWLTPASGLLYRDFMPQDLSPLLDAHAISETILVQAAPSVAETRFLLDIARDTPSVAGVVGWVDFAAADAPATIAGLAQDRLLVGLRPMVQDIADDDWLLDPRLDAAFAALAAHGLVFDALVLPRHLRQLLVRARRHSKVTFVIDHAAKPFIRAGTREPWRRELAELAACANTACKLSGLASEASENWSVGDLAPYAEHVLATFGAQRTLWGSDWPVVEKAGGYARWYAAAQALAGGHPGVFGDNAARIYLSTRGRSARC
jgi:L-fuconolactonase